MSHSKSNDRFSSVMEVVREELKLFPNIYTHFAFVMSHSKSNDRFSSVKEVVCEELKLFPNIYTHFAFVMSHSKSNDRFSSVMEVVCEEGRITTGGVKCRTNTLPLIGISCQFRAG